MQTFSNVEEGQSCPLIPADAPLWKKILLFFFSFGVCPMCITLSISFNTFQFLRKFFVKKKLRTSGDL